MLMARLYGRSGSSRSLLLADSISTLCADPEGGGGRRSGPPHPEQLQKYRVFYQFGDSKFRSTFLLFSWRGTTSFSISKDKHAL